MTIGEAMRASRKKAGLTMRQLSELSGVPEITIGANERGTSIPGVFTVIDLSDALGISVDEYIGHNVAEVPAKTEFIKNVPKHTVITQTNIEPFKDRVRKILKQRNITVFEFTEDTGIDRGKFFHSMPNKRSRHVYMAIAYYFGMNVDELVAGTDAEFDLYGDCGI